MKAIQKPIFALSIACLTFFTACRENPIKRIDETKQQEPHEDIQAQGPTLDDLNRMFQELNKKLNDYEAKDNTNRRISGLEEKIEDSEKSNLRLLQLLLSKEKKSIIVNLNNNDQFQRIDTSLGFFFLAPEQIEKEGETYHVRISIGNPFLCGFDKAKLKVNWKNSEGTKSEKEFEIETPLKGGKWNDVDFVIDSISEEGLEKVEISLETPSVQLYQ